VVPGQGGAGVTQGVKADAVLGAYKAVQAALRLLRPGNKNTQVTELITKIAESYKLNGLEGVLSHELKKHLIDGNNVILNKESFDQRVDEHEF
jgi:methionine aminopeptidase